MFATKKAGLVTKLVILLIIIYACFNLWQLRDRIGKTEIEVADLTNQVQSQRLENSKLSDAIANSDDPEHRKDIARDKLGLLAPGERLFYITD